MARKLTGEEIAREDAFLRGLPRLNIGALFMPPVWGPVHGFWATILYYPALLLVDDLIYAATREPTPLAVILAVLVSMAVVAVSVVFAIVSQPIAAHRAEARGVSRQRYLQRQRIWAVVSIALFVVMVGLATYYNIAFRPLMEG